MNDIRLIRKNPNTFRQGLASRGVSIGLVDQILEADEWRRGLQSQLENLHSQLRQLSDKARSEPSLREEARAVGDQIALKEKEINTTEQEVWRISLEMPNMPDPSVPVGPDSSSNVIIRTWGTQRNFTFQPRPHWEIGEHLGILDFGRASKLAGSRFPLLWNEGAMLEHALQSFMLHHHHKRGYKLVSPPHLVNEKTMTASGNLPKFADQLYSCPMDGLYLIPTAEVGLVNIYMGEVLAEADLPQKLTACTPCFRREAGAGGRDARGLIRVHQFYKVELVKLTTPETSVDEHEAMLEDAGSILEALELPYRVVLLCTGDLGFAAAKTYDLEVWLPGHGEYREISSCSNCTDFQARRGDVRYRPANGHSLGFVHGLNGSGVAVGRTIVAILENYQNQDGSVTIPQVLRPYMGIDRIDTSKLLFTSNPTNHHAYGM